MKRFHVLSGTPPAILALTLLLAAGRLATPVAADEHGDLSPLDAVTPWRDALVWVQYDITYHEGEAPRGIGWGEPCPNCGRIHGNQLEQRILAEAPVRAPGFLLQADRVLTPDILVHPRFIRGIKVVAGKQTVHADAIAFRRDEPGILLALDEPLAGIPALELEPRREAPYLLAYRRHLNGIDQFLAQEAGGITTMPESGQPFLSIPAAALVTDRAGIPVGIRLTGELPLHENWKGNPLDADWLDADTFFAHLQAVEDVIEHGLLEVAMHFRSPRPVPGQSHMSHRQHRYHSPHHAMPVDKDATEHHAVGIVIAPDRILVPAGLPPELTARLERIHIRLADGSRISAAFAGSLKDYQALWIQPERPLEQTVPLDFTPIPDQRHQLRFGAEIRIEPGIREVHVSRLRIDALTEGYRGHIMPSLPAAGHSLYIFNDTSLTTIPIQQRDRLQAMQSGGRHRSSGVMHYPLAYWRDILNDPESSLDAANIPREPDEEMRIAWIGVELQPMDYDLALLHGVLRQTENGQSGAIVTHVYEDSPAQAQDLRVGDILLRITIDDLPAPVNLRLGSAHSHHQTFQWEMLDQMPPQYFDRLSPPWPDADNPFNRFLTHMGEGTGLTLDIMREKVPMQKQFTIRTGPPTYASAARLNVETLGLTVRNLTYEVRNFLQHQQDDPGILVSRIEPGGKAAVAGIRPFELITHVNGHPVQSIAAFEPMIGAAGDKQLTVQRMAASRLTRIAE